MPATQTRLAASPDHERPRIGGHNTSIDKLGRQSKVTRPDPAGDPQSRFTVNRCDAVGYSVQPSR